MQVKTAAPLEVAARVLPPPSLIYGGARGQNSIVSVHLILCSSIEINSCCRGRIMGVFPMVESLPSLLFTNCHLLQPTVHGIW